MILDKYEKKLLDIIRASDDPEQAICEAFRIIYEQLTEQGGRK